MIKNYISKAENLTPFSGVESTAKTGKTCRILLQSSLFVNDLAAEEFTDSSRKPDIRMIPRFPFNHSLKFAYVILEGGHSLVLFHPSPETCRDIACSWAVYNRNFGQEQP